MKREAQVQHAKDMSSLGTLNSVPRKVAVITTVYNGEPHLRRSLSSIAAQTYKTFEYVIVDDGSTDRTPDLLADAASRDPRIRIISPGRKGRTGALNLAIRSVKAEYIAIQDADDLSHPTRLASQVDFLERHPEIGLVGAYYELVDDNRNERYVRMPPVKHYDIVRAMAKLIPIAHTLATYRRIAWLQAGGYPDVEDIEDLLLWIAFARNGWGLANLPEVLGEHWVHPSSFWHRQFSYSTRQRALRRANRSAIRELGLPRWMMIYPLGRSIYGLLPNKVKQVLRRALTAESESHRAPLYALVERSER